MMKIVKRFTTPDGKEFIAFRASNGHIVIAPDPHAYQDIVNMPATIDVGFGVQIYNYTAITLYFTVLGSGGGAPWSWASAVELGSIGSGANRYIHVPSLGSRSKPASAVDDDTVLTFRAYSDAGYTTEVGAGYPVVVTYHWIDSDDLTLLDLDNFDADTLEDWAESVWETFAIDTGYVLSAPNSALATYTTAGTIESKTVYISKSFAVPAATIAYLIVNVKYAGWIHPSTTSTSYIDIKEMRISKAGTIIARTGGGPLIMTQPWNVQNKSTNWLRMVAPISVDETAEYRLETTFTQQSIASGWPVITKAFYDNLKVVYN